MPYTPEEQVNRTKWDEVAPIHLRSYGLDRLRRGHSMLGEIERRELGDITGVKTLHLQCHIGHDTLSLALAGADVTGVDFSEKSIAIARQLADELQLDARFLVGNVLHLNEALDERFDLVFTSNGVLCWIRDIELWAKNIGDHLNDGGTFYIYEYHPFAYVFDIVEQKLIEYEMADGRTVSIEFIALDDGVKVTETFDAEDEHEAELQRQGWQSILNNFARHVESKEV